MFVVQSSWSNNSYLVKNSPGHFSIDLETAHIFSSQAEIDLALKENWFSKHEKIVPVPPPIIYESHVIRNIRDNSYWGKNFGIFGELKEAYVFSHFKKALRFYYRLYNLCPIPSQKYSQYSDKFIDEIGLIIEPTSLSPESILVRNNPISRNSCIVKLNDSYLSWLAGERVNTFQEAHIFNNANEATETIIKMLKPFNIDYVENGVLVIPVLNIKTLGKIIDGKMFFASRYNWYQFTDNYSKIQWWDNLTQFYDCFNNHQDVIEFNAFEVLK